MYAFRSVATRSYRPLAFQTAPFGRFEPIFPTRRQRGYNPRVQDSSSSVKQTIGYVAVVVRDYDEAIAFYTKVLGFELIEDTKLSEAKRWVLVAPPNSAGTCLLLARAANKEQEGRIGNQTGGAYSCSFTRTTSGVTTMTCGRVASSLRVNRARKHTEPWRSSWTCTEIGGTSWSWSPRNRALQPPSRRC